MSQIVELLDDFPSMSDHQTCVAYADSLNSMLPENKAESYFLEQQTV